MDEIALILLCCGWFISIAVAFILYIRIRYLTEEIKNIKESLLICDYSPPGE